MENKKASKKQEKQIAKLLGGNVQSNSGATPFHKGDVVTKHFLIEAKTSVNPKTQYIVKKKDLEKLSIEKFSMGKHYCALAFNFGPDSDNYYIIPQSQFISLLNLVTDCID